MSPIAPLPRRRRNPPGNAQAKERRCLMGSGERLRGEPTEGVRRRFDRGPISQVTGQRGGRSLRPAAFFLFGASGKQEHGSENSTLRNARRSRGAHRRLRRLGHAGQLRLPDRGTPRRASRRRHVRRLAHVRRRPARRARARLPAPAAGQRRRQADRAGQGALLLHAARKRRRHRRPDRLLPRRPVLPPGRECRHARQGHRLAARARGRLRSRGRAALRPRDDRGAGPQREAEGRHAARRGPRRPCARPRHLFRHGRRPTGSSHAPDTRARTAGRSFCPRAKRPISGRGCAEPA